ncbi:MAG: triose-phosphate isomerase [Deltaproteobacteria bacterium]|nr:triose-phosphate isomerase [Deltaproteobacteria bacterium]
MRRLFIAGNWKLNKNINEAERFASELKSALIDINTVDIAVAPTVLALPTVCKKLQHTNIEVSAQNIHSHASGAFTGEIAAEMIRAAGATYTIIGHSERRAIFGEKDEFINQKVHAAFRSGLLPILCVGETLEQREAGHASSIVITQLKKGLNGLSPDQLSCVTIAYEPVWAIGTGKTASPEQAQDMHAQIRSWLYASFPAFVGDQLRIQYGGSVKPHNAHALLSKPDIDGALIGGASLKVEAFVSIIETAASL